MNMGFGEVAIRSCVISRNWASVFGGDDPRFEVNIIALAIWYLCM
jgi:hypothetical protein